MLDLPEHALAVIQSRADWTPLRFEASFLAGEAMRSLGATGKPCDCWSRRPP